jgi:hypothetical protein
MGLYQVCPGEPVYTLGRPMLDRAAVDMPGGRFEIVAHNNSPENKYVAMTRLNGVALSSPFIRYSDIAAGGRLEFDMAAEPALAPSTVRFEEKRWDFGRILEADGEISHSFGFENIGNEPLVIIEASATCGCTVVEFDRKPVKAGGRGEITVTLDPANRPRSFDANIYIKTSAGRIVLPVSGEIVPRKPGLEEVWPFEAADGVRFSKDRFSFGRVEQGESKSLSFEVVNTSSQTAVVEFVSPKPYIIIPSPGRLEPGASCEVTVTCDLRKTEARGFDDLYITMTVNGKPSQTEIRLRAILVDRPSRR